MRDSRIIDSIYESFEESADMLRKREVKNAKLVMRHSMRDKIPKGQMGENVLLNREGEKMAQHFGRHFGFKVGIIHTSIIKRCVQTARLFAEWYGVESKPKITFTRVLTDCYIENMHDVMRLFAKHSPYFIMQRFMRGEKLAGMKDKAETMRLLLDYIFRSEREDMEIFITHDTFLFAIVCHCFGIVPLDFDVASAVVNKALFEREISTNLEGRAGGILPLDFGRDFCDDSYEDSIALQNLDLQKELGLSLDSIRQKLDSGGFLYKDKDTCVAGYSDFLNVSDTFDPVDPKDSVLRPGLSRQKSQGRGFVSLDSSEKRDHKIRLFEWPYMLEGAFLYRRDSRIYCIFRGEERSVEHKFCSY